MSTAERIRAKLPRQLSPVSLAPTRHGAQGVRAGSPETIWPANRTVLLPADREPVLRLVLVENSQPVRNTPALLLGWSEDSIRLAMIAGFQRLQSRHLWRTEKGRLNSCHDF